MGLNTITRKVVIAKDDDLSDAVDVRGLRLVAVSMPAAWTTAALTFQASVVEDATGAAAEFHDVQDDSGTETSITAAASEYIIVGAAKQIRGAKWLKVRSGTASSGVDQDADRTVTLSFVKDRMG